MAEVVKLQVRPEVVEVEVNDDGDRITLPVSDERFIKKVFDYAERMTEEAKNIPDSETATAVEIVAGNINFHESAKSEFDVLFGAGAYKKVFGDDILVGAEYILEFIEGIAPILSEYTTKRIQKIKKYSADRVGSSL